ncbi:hypothetical protein OESDEN_23575 [Oesophagostomum dentatum]|uniref:Uncharacterized protein n=1 Tax=Oesophagostomum dentatum TaxID=61180 RepID=A0A0B1S0R7_OESDE|nr:hypothetical protein OESDEN_23575 [Oesophagostomum dentatum]
MMREKGYLPEIFLVHETSSLLTKMETLLTNFMLKRNVVRVNCDDCTEC